MSTRGLNEDSNTVDRTGGDQCAGGDRRKQEVKDNEYGGYRIGQTAIGITHLPNRKRPVLYVQKGARLFPVAYFNNELAAQEFWKEFERFIERTARND